MTQFRKQALVAALAMASTAPVFATDSVQHTSELSVMGVYIEPDSDRTDEYGSAARIIYGLRLDQNWWVEPQFTTGVMETGIAGATDFYHQELGADISYRLFGDAEFTPYVLVGGGLSRNDVANDRSKEFAGYANAGLGLLTSPLTESGLRLRADARYLFDTFSDNYSDIQIGLGITVPIGVTRRQIVEKVTVIERPVVVESERVVQLADSDNDGVVDGVDQCPNTLEGLQVNAVGCVDTAEAQSVVLRGVTFEFNSNRLTANARDILNRAADALNGQTDLKVELAGHTDNVGSESYNQQLSQKRADAVREYLIEMGVNAGQMSAVGYGESQPIRSNDTEEGRERNRRVEFNVVSE
ncbi:OmpA family protein [Marinobacter mobilis]|uniref:OmpA-OmpF porin, OOP family n=1 Tax=Marinobacter mobilis TaxID=488533 RepID=A0A1H2T039_9GAMM|nr:OmpA family protein [Marinobacter mobilis]SDW37346.1 OmpA-OmpF porin, OOP family [Marinobacter mobilis]